MFLADGGYLSWIYGTNAASHNSWTTEGRAKFSLRGGCAILMDSEKSFRKIYWPGYKEKRVEKREQDPEKMAKYAMVKMLVNEVMMEDPTLAIMKEWGLEADDLVACAVNQALAPLPIRVFGIDKDLLQLPRGTCVIERSTGERSTISSYARRNPKALWPYITKPDDILLDLCIMGDDSDSIPRLVPPRQLDIAERIFVSDQRWMRAYDLFGQDLVRNLYLAVLPSPWCFSPVPTPEETLEIVNRKEWHDLRIHPDLANRITETLEVVREYEIAKNLKKEETQDYDDDEW